MHESRNLRKMHWGNLLGRQPLETKCVGSELVIKGLRRKLLTGAKSGF
jgi:hypothetical protein